MTPPWTQINELEAREDLLAAIDLLERSLQIAGRDPDCEIVTRLGLNLWYAVAESGRIDTALPVPQLADRFVSIHRQWHPAFADDADFCWVFGLGISLFWHMFPGTTEAEGQALLARAKMLDPFWERFDAGAASEQEILQRLGHRGLLSVYYGLPASKVDSIPKRNTGGAEKGSGVNAINLRGDDS